MYLKVIVETGNGNNGLFIGFKMKVLEATVAQFECIIRELVATTDMFQEDMTLFCGILVRPVKE
jgi:hypothetical protein